jgi:hypothetical protein
MGNQWGTGGAVGVVRMVVGWCRGCRGCGGGMVGECGWWGVLIERKINRLVLYKIILKGGKRPTIAVPEIPGYGENVM